MVDQRLFGRDLLSFGISGDWQFEKDWWASADGRIRIVTYDGSIGALKFIGTAIASSFRLHKPDLALRNWANMLDYYRFLKAKTAFHRKFITRSLSNYKHESFATAMEHQGLEYPVFLKIDIEGAEYELLDLIVKSQQDIAGLAIEFHSPLSNIEAISSFAAQLALNIANVHVNNCVPKAPYDITEPCIEISFSRHMGIGNYQGLPHPLERDNDPTCQPIEICWA